MAAYLQRIKKLFVNGLAGITLGQRVGLAFASIVLAISVFYSVSFFYSAMWIELTLSSEHMGDQLHAKLKAIEKKVPPQVNDGVWLFGEHPWTEPIPEKWKDAPEGFSEVTGDVDEPSYYIYKETVNGRAFILVKDQSSYERLEQLTIKLGILIILFLTVSGAVWGILVYKMVMAPVRKLAREVTQASEAEHYERLRPLPQHDDISILARCCDQALYRLHQALEREQTFSGDVSHEIRNPLNVIQGSLELLSDSDLNDRQRRQVERATKAASDIKILIEDFLTFVRDARNLGASSADTVPAMFKRMQEIWGPEAESRGLSFRVKHTGNCGGVYSMVLLGSVLNNLIRNAVTYTTEGSITLEETDEGICVTDSAGGIDPKEAQAIFEPFYRGRLATPAQGEPGYGLGLSIVLRVCRRCGWKIFHENVQGGSRFTVLLKGGAIPKHVLTASSEK